MRSGLQKQAGAAQRWLVKSRAERRGGERGDDGGMRMRMRNANANAKCECECAEWRVRLAACVVWAACVVVVVVRARAKARSGMRKRGHAKRHAKQAACRCEGGGMMGSGGEGTHVQAPFRVELGIAANRRLLAEVFSFRKKLTKKRKFLKVSKRSFESF